MTTRPFTSVTVPVPTEPITYEVRIGRGLLADLGSIVREVAPHSKCAIFAEARVFDLHGTTALKSLRKAGYEVINEPFPGGEDHKSMETVTRLLDTLLNRKWERQAPIIALGGGITGDIVGFVAAIMLRGVPVIQVPTTLLSMVDSSVGGKTGVNAPQGKNLIGAFHYPTVTVVDPDILVSLPSREYRCGLSECVKHGIIGDPELFAWIDAHTSELLAAMPEVIQELVVRNVEFKRNIVAIDPLEKGIRALLNLGHTFGHAIEATSGYGTFLHGEAVALGTVAACSLAVQRKLCEPNVLESVTDLLSRLALPVRAELPSNSELIDAMTRDKKVVGGKIRLVLPTAIGQAAIYDDTDQSLVAKAWDSIRTSA